MKTLIRLGSMDKYEQLSVIGEGSYGVVLKCRHRSSGELVAIKKFLETEDDVTVKKIALREIRMLKKLRHDHLVNLIEVFRRKRRFYLVFEFLEQTLLDQLENNPGGLGEETSKKYLYQLLKGLEYCHSNSIIHRDVKPENVLISNLGIVKLCDLGFARTLAAPGEQYTEYVATRWYRAPELLVAEPRYGPEVDIWAVGCIYAEMLTGEPLFPGDSDIDQLALIIKIVGKLAPRHQQVVSRLSSAMLEGSSRNNLPGTGFGKEFLALCLRTEPRARPQASLLLRHKYFILNNFAVNFKEELRKKLGKAETPSSSQLLSSRLSARPRMQWSVNMQGSISSRKSSTTESLIDYNYTLDDQSTDSNVKSYAKQHSYNTVPYPKTPHIKKVSSKEKEEQAKKIYSKKIHKKTHGEVTLPHVAEAGNVCMKKLKKSGTKKTLEVWQNLKSGNFSSVPKNLVNLPFM